MNLKLPEHKASLTIQHNDHKGDYFTVKEYIDYYNLEDEDWVSLKDKELCIQHNELWELTWYPHTPVGCYTVYGFTLDNVLKKANEIK